MRVFSSRTKIPGFARSNIVDASSGSAGEGTACSATVDAFWGIATAGTACSNTVDNKLRRAGVRLRDFVGRVEEAEWSAKNKD